MRILRPHLHRYDVVNQLQQMDPITDAHAIYRATTMLDLPGDTRFGLNLAFYRTFAVPRIAALLAHTGQMAHDPAKRSFDTGLWMYELIEHGLDHPRGREVVRGLNRMHHRWHIANEDYLYVLSAFVVVPTRWIDQVAWRSTTPVERQATATFYARLGALMAIRNVPDSYETFAAFFDAYEAEHVTYSQAGAAMMRATQEVIARRLPRRLRFLGAPLTSALLEEHLAHALGLASPPPGLRVLLQAALALRAIRERRRAPRQTGWFVSGRPVRGVYPEGYQLSDLGPDSLRDGTHPAPR